jgi:hypothetical protein
MVMGMVANSVSLLQNLTKYFGILHNIVAYTKESSFYIPFLQDVENGTGNGGYWPIVECKVNRFFPRRHSPYCFRIKPIHPFREVNP